MHDIGEVSLRFLDMRLLSRRLELEAIGCEASERSRFDPFVVATGDARPRDQRYLMERPLFSLAKVSRAASIRYEAGGSHVFSAIAATRQRAL
jgi:hypothetical protein